MQGPFLYPTVQIVKTVYRSLGLVLGPVCQSRREMKVLCTASYGISMSWMKKMFKIANGEV